MHSIAARPRTAAILLSSGAVALLAALACSSSEEPAPEAPAAPDAARVSSLRFVEVSAQAAPSMSPVSGRMSAVADLDGDGKPDVAQPAGHGVRLFWNQGGGKLERGTDLPGASSAGTIEQVLAADFNADGALDLILVQKGGGRSRVLINDRNRAFRDGDPLPIGIGDGIHAVSADLDGDGDADVVLTQLGSAPGDGGVPPTDAGTDAADGGTKQGDAAADSGDAASATEPVAFVLVNDGKGHFTDQTSTRLAVPALRPWGVAAGDVDGNGSADLFFTVEGTDPRLLLNDGQGVFRDAPPDALPDLGSTKGRIPAIGNLGGDSLPDIFVASADRNVVLWNDGKGRFVDQTPVALGASPGTGYSAAIADLDADGAMDLVVASPEGGSRSIATTAPAACSTTRRAWCPRAPRDPTPCRCRRRTWTATATSTCS
jgi:hypothetical protein